jgi:hypothetical protein
MIILRFRCPSNKMRAFYRLYKPFCVLILFVLFLAFSFFLFCQPYQANYYLPKNLVIDLKSVESNTCKFFYNLSNSLIHTLSDELFQKKLRHRVPLRVVHQPVKHVYPRRQNMEECKPLFGQIGIFVAVNTDHDKK